MGTPTVATLARFFDRVFAAAGSRLSVSRATLENGLRDAVVVLQCGHECEVEGNARWIAELLVAMLARLYPRLAIEADDAAREHLIGLARSIHPKISIEGPVEEPAVAVAIGRPKNPIPGAVFPRADGWVARLLFDPVERPDGVANPYAAGAAAAFAAAFVFRRVFQDGRTALPAFEEINVSLLDYSNDSGADLELTPNDVGQVAVVGLGAVGNPAVWALARHHGLNGELWLIDPETVELSNLQRYVLALDQDVDLPKVELTRRELAATSLRLHLQPESLEAFADRRGNHFDIPTICVSVDNVEGRRVAQALLPRLVVNGWTSETGLGTSWHRFDANSACLACLYHPKGIGLGQIDLVAAAFGLEPKRAADLWLSDQVPTENELRRMEKHLGAGPHGLDGWKSKPLKELYTQVVCGAVSVDLAGVGRVESVPLTHQSVLAGLLMAAELIKRTDPQLESLSQREVLVTWGDVLRPPPTHWSVPRAKEAGCFCGDGDYQAVWNEKWGESGATGH